MNIFTSFYLRKDFLQAKDLSKTKKSKVILEKKIRIIFSEIGIRQIFPEWKGSKVLIPVQFWPY